MEQRRAGLKRLIQTGRSDLLHKYRKSFEALGLFDVPDAYTAQAIQELEQYSEEYLQGLTSSETDESVETEEAGGTGRVGRGSRHGVTGETGRDFQHGGAGEAGGQDSAGI